MAFGCINIPSIQCPIQDAHLIQDHGVRVWEASVPGVELRPRYDFTVGAAGITMRGLTLSVRTDGSF